MKLIWNDFEQIFDLSEGDRIFWYLIDVIFREKPDVFPSCLDNLVSGYGFSPFQEGMGVSLYGNNDEDRLHPYVNIYQGDCSYRMSVKRFVSAIKIAAVLYSDLYESGESSVFGNVKKLLEWADQVPLEKVEH